MSKRVFVSYNFREDASLARNIGVLFQPWERCNGTPVFVERDVSAQGEAVVDREIRRVMEPCVAAVFVVGDSVHNSPWINREAQLAKSMGLRIVAVRAPNTRGNVPNELRENGIPVLEWDRDGFCDALNRVLG